MCLLSTDDSDELNMKREKNLFILFRTTLLNVHHRAPKKSLSFTGMIDKKKRFFFMSKRIFLSLRHFQNETKKFYSWFSILVPPFRLPFDRTYQLTVWYANFLCRARKKETTQSKRRKKNFQIENCLKLIVINVRTEPAKLETC